MSHVLYFHFALLDASCSVFVEDIQQNDTFTELQNGIHDENNDPMIESNTSETCKNYSKEDNDNHDDQAIVATDNDQIDKAMPNRMEFNKQDEADNIVTTETGDLELPSISTKTKEYPNPKKRLKTARVFEENKVERESDVTENIEEVVSSKSTTKRRVAMIKKNYSCKNCGCSFKNISVFGRHKKKCIYLPISPMQDQIENEHQETEVVAEDKLRSCDQCNITFKTDEDLHDHLKIHSKLEALICLQCNDVFYDQKAYKVHIQGHEEPKYKCDQCDKAFQFKSTLTKHKRSHKETYQCNNCNSNFVSKEKFDSHDCQLSHSSKTQTIHVTNSITENKHICDICQKEFPKRRGLLTHRKLHSVQLGNKHTCELCSKGFKSKNSLMKHMRFVHSESRDFVCDVCGKSFKQQDTLNCHLKTHDENRSEFKCPECGKSLATSGSLKVHLRTHQDVRPFMCDVCGMSFHQKGNLAKHMLSHTNKTSHKCEKCGKDFKYSDTLKTHLRAHALKDGLNDYELSAYGKHYTCEVCGKKMASVSQYKVHLRTHTNERPYECTICRKSFKEGGKLKRHMRTHEHPEHVEHNYISNLKAERNSGFTEITMRHQFSKPSQKLTPRKDQSEESMIPDVSTEVTLQNANSVIPSTTGYIDNVTYQNDTDGGLMMMKPTPFQNNSSVSEVRVIDENRHQFLMHQLTPVSNLMVEAPRPIQVSACDVTDEQIVHVAFGEENHIAPSVYSEVLVHSDFQSNQSNTIQSFTTKYL